MLLPLLLLLQQDPLSVRPDTVHPANEAIHHDVRIVVGDSGNHVLGLVQTTWVLRSDSAVEVPLDTAFRVIRVLADGDEPGDMESVTFALLRGGGIYIPHRRHIGDTLHTSIRYHGFVHDGLIVRTDSSGRRTIFADNWPDRVHRWLPVTDHPSDKVTVDFHVEVPVGMSVVANGVLTRIDTLAYRRRVWNFTMRQRIPPYGMVIGAGPLTTTTLPDAACEVKCVPLAVVTYPEDSAWATAVPFRRAGDMVDFYSRFIGPFPYDRLSHVESTTIFGGMENPTAIFYDGKAYPSHRLSELTVAHETAHQWFGDAVTERDWHHLWLSEGFATYFSALWLRHADGDSAFQAEMRRDAEVVMRSPASDRPILDPTATDLMGLLNSNNYPKGAWVLHSLRGLIGDSAFQHGIRDWYATYRDSTALSSDFSAVMGKAAGRDLDWYFRQMLTQPGFPKLEVSWSTQKPWALTLRQTQPEAWGLYRMPGLIIRVDGRDFTADVDGRETVVPLPGLQQAPRDVVVDPAGWWLAQVTVVGA